MPGATDPALVSDLPALDAAVSGCRACPRLVAWREEVAATKRAAFRDETYWGRPVPGFGAVDARLLIVGPRPRGPRRQPHRAHVHRRPQRRRPLRRAARRRSRVPADVGRDRRRPRALRRPDHRAGALRPAREQAHARTSATAAGRGSPASSPCCATRCARSSCSAGSGGRRCSPCWPPRTRGRAPGLGGPASPSGLRARGARDARAGRTRRGGPARGVRQLPRQPAEHLHRTAHPGDARGRPRRRGPRRRPGTDHPGTPAELGSGLPRLLALVAQSAEAGDLKSPQCGFEPHRGHHLIADRIVTRLPGSSPARHRRHPGRSTACHPPVAAAARRAVGPVLRPAVIDRSGARDEPLDAHPRKAAPNGREDQRDFPAGR